MTATAESASHDWIGKVCVVTGGGNGIGAAVCRSFGELGAEVVIVDKNADAARAVAADVPRNQVIAADVSDYELMSETIGKLERIDVLVNNAGWDRVEPFLRNDPELWQRLIAINLLGVFNCSHVTLPIMIAAGGGRIVNVSSDAGRVGSSGEAAYSACKGGTISLTKSLAREHARHQVCVNCVCPGPTDTQLMAEITADERAARTMDAIVQATPTRRLASPAEVAAAVVFFAGAPDQITGQVLSVSGGLTMAG